MTDPSAQQQNNYGRYAIAVSVLCLAASITYFAQQLSSLEKVAETLAVYRDVAPELVAEVASISEKIPSVVDEVAAVRAEIPAVVAEVTAVRAQIPAVLDEVSALRRETIPAVLVEIDALRKTTIPAVLDESQSLRSDTIPMVVTESTALREQTIPALLSEVKITREQMPELLAQANEVARSAGRNASEGAVSGFFTGLVRAPLNIASGVSESMFKGKSLTEIDKQMLTEASHKVLAKDYLEAKEVWENTASGRRGEVTISAMSVADDERCRTLSFNGYHKRKSLGATNVNVCHDAKGVWTIVE